MLLSLVDGPRHGYGIKLDVEERTDEILRFASERELLEAGGSGDP